MSEKSYNTSPLPFMGQKRRFVAQFRKALHSVSPPPRVSTFVDLFGGSGLLSHVAKHEHPEARVIYNDYDNFHCRVEQVANTNKILDEIRTILYDVPLATRVAEDKRQAIIDRLKYHELNGFVDYITISSSILFPGNYATNIQEIESKAFYNSIKSTPYCCDGYLDGLEIVRLDYRELFAQYEHTPGVVFLVDPPYLSTQSGHYGNYWRLADYLDVFSTIEQHPFFYFTSDKSSAIEFFDWMEARGYGSPLKGAIRKEVSGTAAAGCRYTDIMLYRI